MSLQLSLEVTVYFNDKITDTYRASSITVKEGVLSIHPVRTNSEDRTIYIPIRNIRWWTTR